MDSALPMARYLPVLSPEYNTQTSARVSRTGRVPSGSAEPEPLNEAVFDSIDGKRFSCFSSSGDVFVQDDVFMNLELFTHLAVQIGEGVE